MREIPIYENPIASTNNTDKGVEFITNFEVFFGDTFVDELGNTYYSSKSKSGIIQVAGNERKDSPQKLAFMKNLLRIH